MKQLSRPSTVLSSPPSSLGPRTETATPVRAGRASSSPSWTVLKLVPKNSERITELTGMTISEIKAARVPLRVQGKRYFLYFADFHRWVTSLPLV